MPITVYLRLFCIIFFCKFCIVHIFLRVQCLNEEVEGSGKTVFKSWEDRFDRREFVQSDVDPELLFNVP